jgi:hypothetical protein
MEPSANQPAPQQQGFYHPNQPSEFHDDGVDGAMPPAPQYDEDEQVAWEASEYIHRAKDARWAIVLGIIVVAVLGVAIWLQEWIFATLVLVMGSAMGYFAFRPPQTKHYLLTHDGLKVDDFMYPLGDYRAFGVLSEDAFFSAMLIPTARFKPALTVYFAEKDGEKIVNILGAHMPMEEIKPDPVDIIMRRLHF